MKAQRGAAILTAMLTVVLVATLASAALWQQWRGIEIEAAERSRTQSAWVLTGALDWARLILREDARKGGSDHLGEPWAVPLAQARLSTFLAADRNQSSDTDNPEEAFLSGSMVDLQSRLNLTNLVQDGKINDASEKAFQRLFKLLNLPAFELTALVDNLRLSQAATLDAQAAGTAPLQPQDLDQLTWLGLSPRSLAVLRPYVTLLPVPTPVNLNTAPAEVIYASVDDFELADAHHLVAARSAAPLAALADALKASGRNSAQFNPTLHSVTTHYFLVSGYLQVGPTRVGEQSVVQREGMDVKTIARQRGVVPQNAPLQ
jgi:general secretion pathway protein K